MTKENRKEKLWEMLSDEFIKADMERLSTVINVEFTKGIYEKYVNNLIDILDDDEINYMISMAGNKENLKLLRGEKMTEAEFDSLMEAISLIENGDIIVNLTKKTMKVLCDMKLEIRL